MAHGGYARRRVEERRPIGQRSRAALGPEKRRKKARSVSLKNQIRSVERMLRKSLPVEVREAQEKKLEELKQQQEIQDRLSCERKQQLRDRKIKFFERRKLERMIRRLEKQQRSSDHVSEGKTNDQLAKLKEDLEYVRFFPKSERYVSLFIGGDKPDMVEKRNKLRKQIKANIVAAVASGKDLEETASDDDALDMSEDDFFLSGSSSDEALADDEWTDRSAREPASSASGKAASGMSSDEKNQRHISARALMPPPRPIASNRTPHAEGSAIPSSSQTSGSRTSGTHHSNKRGSSNARTDCISNLSSNSDARKPRRKRRPKKKKQVQGGQ